MSNIHEIEDNVSEIDYQDCMLESHWFDVDGEYPLVPFPEIDWEANQEILDRV